MRLEQRTVERSGALTKLLLIVSAAFYASGFFHPRADFPNGSPWVDWSKMTDEGWYGGGAIHHFVWGHWYLPNSFNPAVAMPVWPVMLAGWFAATGVSMLAARILTMLLYGASLCLLFFVVRRASGSAVWGSLSVVLTVLNPFCWAFDRLALLEPITVFWMMLALWLAPQIQRKDILRQLLLGFVLALLVLTKATGVALVPAILYLLSTGDAASVSLIRRLLSATVVTGTMLVLWLAYVQLIVRPQYLADYNLLFSVNDYHAHLSIIPKMALVTLRDGEWLQPILWILTGVILLMSTFWLRKLWQLPLFVTAVLAIAGHLAFVGYHTNFQPRYYLVIAMPVSIVLVLGSRAIFNRRIVWLNFVIGTTLGVAIAVMGVTTFKYVVTPRYSFLLAAQGIAAVVQADHMSNQLLLSDSGDDITMLTGLRSVPEPYAVNGLETMLRFYKPGWYAAWLGSDDESARKVGHLYRLQEVARYWVFDDPNRHILVLYKLTSHSATN